MEDSISHCPGKEAPMLATELSKEATTERMENVRSHDLKPPQFFIHPQLCYIA